MKICIKTSYLMRNTSENAENSEGSRIIINILIFIRDIFPDTFMHFYVSYTSINVLKK